MSRKIKILALFFSALLGIMVVQMPVALADCPKAQACR